MATVRRCDVQDGDDQFVAKFVGKLETLTGMVEEMIDTNPAMILSPVLRRMLSEKAVEVREMFDKIKWRFVVDNPGEPLK